MAEELNPLQMSDEDIDAAIAAEFARMDSIEEPTEPEEVEEDGLQEEEQQETEDEVEDAEEPFEEDLEEESTDDVTEEEEAVEEPSEASEETEETTAIDDSETIDYKAQYEALFAPFKANGKEMQIDNIDDARTLMQMGANYNKKMAALKPNLKLMKMLENNNLLDNERLSFLIDLDKKNPEAIKKLLQDSNIDPLDLDVSGNDSGTYKPSSYNVSDAEVALDSVLDEIKETPSFNRTMDIVGTKWDESSQSEIVKEPELIRIINSQVESGVYDRVMSVVERERVLGRLNGLSDIQAYYQVGRALAEQEAKSNQTSQSMNIAPQNNVNRASNTVDPKLKSRKKAASSTKSAPRAKTTEDFNPLSMSDEEFEKLVASKFI